MSASASNVRASSAHSSASTLRPRNKRLISGLDEGDEATLDPPAAATTTSPSPFGGRSTSPNPTAHPQRSNSNSRRTESFRSLSSPPTRGTAGRQRRPDAESNRSLAGLWGNSWTALQGIASQLLGNDLVAGHIDSQPRTRKPLGKLSSTTDRPSPSPAWGPSAPASNPQLPGIGAGTAEEHVVALRARKRKDMLAGSESSYADALGKFKRRLSDDHNSASAPPGEGEDREAMVYLHHVKKNDTLAGITIRYNISANVLRKANRMWPNDTVQARKTLMLPVDACGVKGRPVSAAEMDLLSSESEALSTWKAEEVPAHDGASSTTSDGRGRNRTRTDSTSTQTTLSAADTESPWHHDSWVMFPGSKGPTEIARLSRRALGYFPPPRRKSVSYSDLDTPSSSLELPRSNTNDVLNPNKPSLSPPPTNPRRSKRRPSNATNGYFPSYLTGPGGVGTMDRHVHFPGPAQDGLNKFLAKHLPDVAPPRNQSALYQPELPLYTDDTTPLGSGAQTPAYPHGGGGSGGGGGLKLENVGGAIESWMRRMATKAVHTPSDRSQAARASVGTPGKGAGGIGDLIEMTNEFEIGGEEEEEADRGSQKSVDAPTIAESKRPGTTATSYFDGASARGGFARDRGTKGGGAKSGKHD